jgi:hypothetical protein
MCLVKIMPGVYNLGSTHMMMQSHIDVEGSGSGMTRILGTVNYSYAFDTELRSLSVESDTLPIVMWGSGRNIIRNAHVIAGTFPEYYSEREYGTTPVPSTQALAIKFEAPVDSLKIIDSVVRSTYQGVVSSLGNWVTEIYVTNSKISSNGGGVLVPDMNQNIYVTGSELTGIAGEYAIGTAYFQAYTTKVIKNSVINGALFNNEIYGPVGGFYKIINSQLPVGVAPARAKCIGVYDAEYNPVVCQ